jgi:hypothetical protein
VPSRTRKGSRTQIGRRLCSRRPALQISYDVALLELPRAVDVETDPNRFEQPQPERLERAFRDLGIALEMSAAEDHAPHR